MTAAEGAVDASPKAGKSWMQGFVNNDEAPYSYTTESGEALYRRVHSESPPTTH